MCSGQVAGSLCNWCVHHHWRCVYCCWSDRCLSVPVIQVAAAETAAWQGDIIGTRPHTSHPKDEMLIRFYRGAIFATSQSFTCQAHCPDLGHRIHSSYSTNLCHGKFQIQSATIPINCSILSNIWAVHTLIWWFPSLQVRVLDFCYSATVTGE